MIDWDRVARESHENVVARLKGRTIVEVKANETSFELVFDDGSRLEVNGYVDRKGCSDVAGLNYEFMVPDLPDIEP